MNVMKKNAFNPIYRLPVNGGAADIKLGAFMKVGATPGTDGGLLIKASGFSATPDILGRINAGLDYSVETESLLNGTTWVTKPIQLAHNFGIFRIEYDLTSVITCTEATTGTDFNVSSLEADIDGCFIYMVAGDSIGQTNYATAAGSNDLTLKAKFGTDTAIGDTFIKILPRFHDLIGLNSDGTKLGSQAAAGAVKGMVIDTIIERNTDGGKQMEPTSHAALTGLNGARSIRFYADVAIRDTAVYSVD